MMAERGVAVSHTTILRWVLRYVPEFEKRWARHARRVNASWRVDETSVPVRGGRHYLYRAVDKYGKTVDFLLCADREQGRRAGFLHEGRGDTSAQMAAQDNARRQRREPPGVASAAQEDSRWRESS